MKLPFKLYLICLFLFMTIFGCGKKKEKLPPGIWKKSQMVEFLTQTQLVEAKLAIQNPAQGKRDSLMQIYYNELFATYDIDKESLEQNLYYYKNKPYELNEIYADVLSKLSIMETELQAGPKDEKKIEQVSNEQE